MRHVFYSFHYDADNWRVGQGRNIGEVSANKAAHDNDWETVKKGGDAAIKKCLADQMQGRSCTVVLIGQNTAGRKWIEHEIVESWNAKMGLVGIYIHGLKNASTNTCAKGKNSFVGFTYGKNKTRMTNKVKCYDPPGRTSQDRYNWIADNLEATVDEAIALRKSA